MAQRVVWWALVAVLMTPLATGAQEAAQEADPGPVVHGVLFYSPTCPHCREVMTETLPPILQRYGPAIEIVTINVATAGGQQLYRATIETLAVPQDRVGVPTLLVGDRILVGAWEIPNLLPGIVDSATAGDGIDWPPVPLVRRALAAQGLIAPEDVAIAEPAAPTGQRAPTWQAGQAGQTEGAAPPASAPAEEAAEEAADSTAVGAEDHTAGETAGEEAAGAERATGEEAGGERVAGDEVAGDNVAGDEVAGDEVAGDEVAGEAVAGQEAAGAPADGADGDTGAAGVNGEGAVTDGAASPDPDSGPAADTLDAVLAGAIDRDGRTALAHELSIRERLMLDPAGNGLAIAVLILMLVAVGLVAADVAGRIRVPIPPPWAIPLLSLVGMGVAAYLAFVEVTGAEAVCGPVGNCNVVQQSPYARILGVPVGVLGVVGYAAMLAVWSAGRLVGVWAPVARVTVWWVALGATGFSIYLTFLEPFVIGASCAWCLTSAVATMLILLAATPERFARDRVGVSPTSRPSVSH